MKILRAAFLFLLFSPGLLRAEGCYELRKGDSLLLVQPGLVWRELKPALREYDNLAAGGRKTITYFFGMQQCNDTLLFRAKEAGTFYFMACATRSEKTDSLALRVPPHTIVNLRAVQIVVRESDDYLGYLTELLRTPFIIPPMTIAGTGHQTDLRMGADCAELAIYGKRREGFDIPYGGPKGICKFLDTLQGKAEAGCILHFGAQVSVLYQDKGIPGAIDDDDLVIESYGSGAKIVPFRHCAFYGRPYRLFTWKTGLPRKEKK